jgi:membrane protease YdiL (CAAX protease family)
MWKRYFSTDEVARCVFITIVIAAPILEELIFRGIILNGLLKATYLPNHYFKFAFVASYLNLSSL